MENYNPNDFNPYRPYGQSPVRQVRPINLFETAAWAVGIASVLSCLTFYGAYILGSLAILFALLSRGGQMQMSTKAKRGMLLGIAAILLTTIIFTVSFIIALDQFGSIEGILREFCNMYGYDFEEMFGELFREGGLWVDK